MSDLNRRKFLRGSAVAGAAAVGSLAAPSIANAAPVTLKMQNHMLIACMQWLVKI